MRSLYITNRFFIVLGAITVAFALGFPFPILFPLAKVLFALFAALTLVEIAVLYLRPIPISCRRETSGVYSLSDPNPVDIHVENTGNLTFFIRVIDELPVIFQRRDPGASFWLAPGQQKKIANTLRPVLRGVYPFEATLVFVSTILGLVQRKVAFPTHETVAVYPSIIQMKRFELRATRQIAHESGIKKMRRIGHSYEFEQIKNYVQGDDYRSVNWKASSRRGVMMVNQYEDERSQQVYCLLDKSRVMRMPFADLSLMDYAINTTLAISNIILKKKDKAGLLTFSDVLGTALRADKSPTQLGKIMEALYREKERAVESNYELLYQAVRKLINARSLLLLFTNFESSYALERALPHIRRLNRFHLLVVVFFENTEIRNIAQEEAETTADVYKQTVARQYLQDKKEMVQKLRQFGIQAILTKPENLTLNTVNKYLELKSRGLI